MTPKQSQDSGRLGQPSPSTAEERSAWPKQGEHYHCEACGMAIEVTADCHCETENGPRLECCGEPLARG